MGKEAIITWVKICNTALARFITILIAGMAYSPFALAKANDWAGKGLRVAGAVPFGGL